MHVKKGDKVIVIAGKEKGKTSIVERAIPSLNKVVLEGLNKVKKHTKPRKAGEKGGIIEISLPMNASNVKLADKATKKDLPASKAGKPVAKAKKAKKATKKA